MKNTAKAPKSGQFAINKCTCGCGAVCTRQFVVGHDSKLWSIVQQLAKGDLTEPPAQILNPKTIEYLRGSAWMPASVLRDLEARTRRLIRAKKVG